MKTAPAIGFAYRPSWVLLATTFVVTVLAVVALQLLHLHGGRRELVFFVIVLCSSQAIVKLWHPRVRALLWRAEGGAEITLRDSALEDGKTFLGAVDGARVIGPLIVLSLRWPPRERTHLWLLPDNLDGDTRRRLRMRLGAGDMQGLASGNADSR